MGYTRHLFTHITPVCTCVNRSIRLHTHGPEQSIQSTTVVHVLTLYTAVLKDWDTVISTGKALLPVYRYRGNVLVIEYM